MAKYEQLAAELRKEIESGGIPVGAQLPGCRELAEQWRVSYVTATKAVRILADAELVKSSPGSGITVISRKGECALPKTAVICPMTGDLFSNLFHSILTAADTLGIRPAPLLGANILGQFSEREAEKKFLQYAREGYDSWIVNAPREFPFSLFREKILPETLTFVLHCDSGIEFPGANRILPDYAAAGELALSHLLARGAEHLVFLTYEQPDARCRKRGAKSRTYDAELFRAFEGRSDVSVIRCGMRGEEYREQLRKELKHGRKCGVFGVGDIRLLEPYRAARELGLEVGRDVFFTGLYNTPWCDVFAPGLTSISIGEEEAGRLAVQSVAEHWKNETVLLKPEIKVRKS